MHRLKFDPTDPKSLMACYVLWISHRSFARAADPELIKKPGE